MKNTHALFLSALLLATGCTKKIPQPSPDPILEKRFLFTLKEDYAQAQSTKLFRSPQPITFTQGKMLFAGGEQASAWVYTSQAFKRDSLKSFSVLVEPSNDFCIGLAPKLAVDANAKNGFFGLNTRARFYMYDGGKPYRHFKRNGVITEGSFSETKINAPLMMELRFKGDSVYYAVNETVYGSDLLGPAFGDSVLFEVSAYNTPQYGQAYMSWLALAYYDRRPVAPDTLIVRWDDNTEPDLHHYLVELNPPRRGQKLFSVVPAFFQTVVYDTSIAVRVFAVDTAGNVSAPSETAYYKRTRKL